MGFTATFPLPADHWLYAEDREPPAALAGTPDREKMRAVVRRAAQYATRSALANGRITDPDPDAFVQALEVAFFGFASVGPTK
jgi:hypothetical protein